MNVPALEAQRRQRPLGIVLIVTFLVIDAVLATAERFFDLQTGTRQDLLADAAARTALVVISLVVLRLIAAVGLWLGWRRGWVLTMLLVGISLVVDLVLWWNGQPAYIRMAIDVVLAFYLNQREVREHFERPPRRATLAALPTGEPEP